MSNAGGKFPSPSPSPCPPPAHPRKRREPLPWQKPKSIADEPEAAARIQAILQSPSYRVANQDVDFLDGDDARGLRLEMDYLKAELLLREHQVARTIVVFGSTRICEPVAARHNVESLEAALRLDQDNPDIARRLTVARRILAKSRYYDIARELGHLIAAENTNCDADQTLVMTGGGPGNMEAANRGAFETGAKTIGLNISLPHEQFPNPYVTSDLCFQFHYFALRKLHFLQRARALVAFPGGYGTFDELFEILTLVQTRKIKPIPIILVGEEFWRKAVDVDFLVEEGVIDAEDRELFWFSETASDIWLGIKEWERLSRERNEQQA